MFVLAYDFEVGGVVAEQLGMADEGAILIERSGLDGAGEWLCGLCADLLSDPLSGNPGIGGVWGVFFGFQNATLSDCAECRFNIGKLFVIEFGAKDAIAVAGSWGDGLIDVLCFARLCEGIAHVNGAGQCAMGFGGVMCLEGHYDTNLAKAVFGAILVLGDDFLMVHPTTFANPGGIATERNISEHRSFVLFVRVISL
jgi:hypothetical protein